MGRPSNIWDLDYVNPCKSVWNNYGNGRQGAEVIITSNAKSFPHSSSSPESCELIRESVLHSLPGDMQNILPPLTSPTHIPLASYSRNYIWKRGPLSVSSARFIFWLLIILPVSSFTAIPMPNEISEGDSTTILNNNIAT